ncbi:hypothetical protein [Microbacterium sp. 1262]|uniref:hypothetical protein n=1 Tax=Microbacterium sp. 1262 TaxID=3156415 RepID=UPI00339664F0
MAGGAPGAALSAYVLARLEPQARSLSRPTEPDDLDEDDRAIALQHELAVIDPHLHERRTANRLSRVEAEALNNDLLAANGVANGPTLKRYRGSIQRRRPAPVR